MMAVAEALAVIRRVGAVESSGGGLKVRFPESDASTLQAAIDALRARRAEALSLLAAECGTRNLPAQSDIDHAVGFLNQSGVRLMLLDGITTIGVWSDMDGPDVREALQILGMDGAPIRYLDADGVPMRYKLRRVPGEPVPSRVLNAMERQKVQPWKIRDRMWKSSGAIR